MKKNRIYILMLVYGIVVASISSLVYGAHVDMYIGLSLGIGSLIVNHWLLVYVIEGIMTRNLTYSVLPIGLSRVLIFGMAGLFCFQQSHMCVLMFAAGILAIPVAALLECLWEE